MKTSQSLPLDLRVVPSPSLNHQKAVRITHTASLSHFVTSSGILSHLPKPRSHRRSVWSESQIIGMSWSVEMTYTHLQQKDRLLVDFSPTRRSRPKGHSFRIFGEIL